MNETLQWDSEVAKVETNIGRGIVVQHTIGGGVEISARQRGAGGVQIGLFPDVHLERGDEVGEAEAHRAYVLTAGMIPQYETTRRIENGREWGSKCYREES